MFENKKAEKQPESLENVRAAMVAQLKKEYEDLAKIKPFTHSFDTLFAVHRASANNGGEVLQYTNGDLICTQPNRKCACFACGHRFEANEWTGAVADENEIILMCPECAIDAILIADEGKEVSETLVDELNRLYFSGYKSRRRRMLET